MRRAMSGLVFAIILIFSCFNADAKGVAVTLLPRESLAENQGLLVLDLRMSGLPAVGGIGCFQCDITFDPHTYEFKKAELNSIKPPSDLTAKAIAEDRVRLIYFDSRGGANGFRSDGVIATIQFSVKEEINPQSDKAFGISGEGFGNCDGVPLTAIFGDDTDEAIINRLESSGLLKHLEVEGYTLKPEFSPVIFNYKLSISDNVSQLNIIALPQSSKATVEIQKDESLGTGSGKIEIVVSSKDNEKTIYTIAVEKENKEYQSEVDSDRTDEFDLREYFEKMIESINNKNKLIILTLSALLFLTVGLLIHEKTKSKAG